MRNRLLLITLGLVVIAVIPSLLLSTVSTSAQEVQPTAPIATWTPGPPQKKTPVPTVLPTSVASPASSKRSPEGASIALHIRFPATWSWAEVHWQDLWTEVQWQNDKGKWCAVDGWRGTLDGVMEEEGAVIGQKTWWVAEDALGTGPFRWQVYQGQGERLLATSGPVDLPGSDGSTVTLEVSLE